MIIDGNGNKFPTVNAKGIYGFFGEYRWLSNFHICPVTVDGMRFTSSEAAFMSYKTDTWDERKRFVTLTPSEAKKLGKTVHLRDDWEYFRITAMMNALLSKFIDNDDLGRKLISTGNLYLEETNDWGDKFWGVDRSSKEGLNMLGKCLMSVRSFIK